MPAPRFATLKLPEAPSVPPDVMKRRDLMTHGGDLRDAASAVVKATRPFGVVLDAISEATDRWHAELPDLKPEVAEARRTAMTKGARVAVADVRAQLREAVAAFDAVARRTLDDQILAVLQRDAATGGRATTADLLVRMAGPRAWAALAYSAEEEGDLVMLAALRAALDGRTDLPDDRVTEIREVIASAWAPVQAFAAECAALVSQAVAQVETHALYVEAYPGAPDALAMLRLANEGPSADIVRAFTDATPQAIAASIAERQARDTAPPTPSEPDEPDNTPPLPAAA